MHNNRTSNTLERLVLNINANLFFVKIATLYVLEQNVE